MTRSIVFLLILLISPFTGVSQSVDEESIGYIVERINKPLSISRGLLIEANTLLDLNANYHEEWVRKYISVEISTVNSGEIRKVIGTNDHLSQEQKENMCTADEGSDIAVTVLYIPENTLKNNSVKEMKFTFQVNPESPAAFIGGEEALEKHLKEKGIDAIAEAAFVDEGLLAVKFNISEVGDIEDVSVIESSNDEKTDELMVDILNAMPTWKPAAYDSGRNVKQEMIITAGNLRSCIMNLVKYTNRR